MSTPYIGEIRMFGGSFAPYGWALCNGQLLSIQQNGALFNLIGTTYGGDGVNTFALPNLQSRVPVHAGNDGGGNNYVLGQVAGTETVTLTAAQNPLHNHTVTAQNNATATSPQNGVYAGGQTSIYRPSPASSMNAAMVQNTGGQPHNNVMPFQVLNFIIALQGTYPSQN